jgi:hypothetical protein
MSTLFIDVHGLKIQGAFQIPNVHISLFSFSNIFPAKIIKISKKNVFSHFIFVHSPVSTY